jgi:hypothetical protein
MIQFYAMMWILAAFGAVIGFLRGWNRELIAMMGILLSSVVLLQLDSILRGTILSFFAKEHIFVIQLILFITVVYNAYTTKRFEPSSGRGNPTIQSSVLGVFAGAINGYLVGGAIWYFMDINEYPFSPLVLAPTPNSPSAEAIGMMPLIALSGGVTGTGEALLIGGVLLLILIMNTL